jgi:ElaB/YqjD/DUF883 family membrane-anchored ribosome-binding protein
MADQRNTAAEVAALRATIEAFMKTQMEVQADAKEIRAKILADIHLIHNEATDTQHRVSNLEKDMATVKPVIAKVNGWHSMLLGGAIVLSLLGGAVSLFWQAVKEKIAATFGA